MLKTPQEWIDLTNEYHVAKDTLDKIFISVNRAFMDKDSNPTNQQLSELELATQKWDDIKNRIHKFIADRFAQPS